jgi:hypothetical protein
MQGAFIFMPELKSSTVFVCLYMARHLIVAIGINYYNSITRYLGAV